MVEDINNKHAAAQKMGSQVHDKDELITISEKNDMIHDEA